MIRVEDAPHYAPLLVLCLRQHALCWYNRSLYNAICIDAKSYLHNASCTADDTTTKSLFYSTARSHSIRATGTWDGNLYVFKGNCAGKAVAHSPNIDAIKPYV